MYRSRKTNGQGLEPGLDICARTRRLDDSRWNLARPETERSRFSRTHMFSPATHNTCKELEVLRRPTPLLLSIDVFRRARPAVSIGDAAYHAVLAKIVLSVLRYESVEALLSRLFERHARR